MNIYPAIDIMQGRAVRLKQGRAEDATDYGDPQEMAARWAAGGASWIHMVDLDGAFSGAPRNIDVIRKVGKAHPAIRIQLGGGLRDMDAIEAALDAKVFRVVLGTAALENEMLVREALANYGERIVIGIDARDGRAQVSGWTRGSETPAVELAQRLERLGARMVVYTDIARDGVMTGPNIEAIRTMLDNTRLHVIASGGVSELDDIRALARLAHPRLDGVIVGRALYEDRFTLPAAREIADAG